MEGRFSRFLHVKTVTFYRKAFVEKNLYDIYVNCCKTTKHDSRNLIIVQCQVMTLDNINSITDIAIL